jgi:hypothetical protein
MTDRESLVTRVNTELNVAQRTTDVFLRTMTTGDPGIVGEEDRWQQVTLYMQAIARSLQMIAEDVDGLYESA